MMLPHPRENIRSSPHGVDQKHAIKSGQHQQPHRNMCYPNEFETDLEKPYKPPGGWICSLSCPVETSMLEAVKGNGISPDMKRRWNFNGAAAKRDGNEMKSGKVALHKNSYPKVMAGISAGTLLAFVIACRLGGKFG